MSSRRSGSLSSLREGNRRLVVEALRERGVASRAELARATDLSRSTISTIVGDLIDSGLAIERDETRGEVSHAGRPGVMVALDPSAGIALALDFGHRHLRVAVSDLSHNVLAERWCQLDVDHSPGEGLAEASRFVDEVLDEAGLDRDRVIGVVMGLPAPINRVTGTVQDASILPGWVGIDAAGEASERLGLTVVMENDANLGALAELTWGAAVGRSEVAYLKVASGVGGALISGGRLAQGVGGTAGEIGHTVVAGGEGPVCRCGNHGCLETLASTRAVANLLSLSRGEQISTQRMLELATSGDAATRRLIGDAGRALGVAVANLCNLVNPECVVIGGDLALAGDMLLDPVREMVGRHAIPSAAADAEIVAGVLGERAEMLGALAFVMREPERFEAPGLTEAA